MRPIHMEQLPPLHNLLKLAMESHFPATREDIELTAQRLGYTKFVNDFMDLFPYGEIFNNRGEFLERCEQLEMLIQEEELSPKEQLRSPQD